MVDVEHALRSLPASVPVEPLDQEQLAARVHHRRRRRRQRRTIGVIVVLLVLGSGAALARHQREAAPDLRTVGPPAGAAECAPQDTTSTDASQFVMTDTPQAQRVVGAVRQQFDAALVHVDPTVLVMALCDNLGVSASSVTSTMTADEFQADAARDPATPVAGLPEGTVGRIDRQPSGVVVEVLRIGDPGTLATVRLGDISQGTSPGVAIDDTTVNRALAIATQIAAIEIGDRRLPIYARGGPPPDTIVLGSLLQGLTLDNAQVMAEGTGWELRVAEQDGVSLNVTADRRPDRINVATADGTITRAMSIS